MQPVHCTSPQILYKMPCCCWGYFHLVFPYHSGKPRYDLDYFISKECIDDLVQNCSNSIANLLELRESCSKSPICQYDTWINNIWLYVEMAHKYNDTYILEHPEGGLIATPQYTELIHTLYIISRVLGIDHYCLYHWHSYAIWHIEIGSPFAQVMDCHLFDVTPLRGWMVTRSELDC